MSGSASDRLARAHCRQGRRCPTISSEIATAKVRKISTAANGRIPARLRSTRKPTQIQTQAFTVRPPPRNPLITMPRNSPSAEPGNSWMAM